MAFEWGEDSFVKHWLVLWWPSVAGLRAHNLLWSRCARCVWDYSIDYEKGKRCFIYTEWRRNVYPQQNGGIFFWISWTYMAFCIGYFVDCWMKDSYALTTSFSKEGLSEIWPIIVNYTSYYHIAILLFISMSLPYMLLFSLSLTSSCGTWAVPELQSIWTSPQHSTVSKPQDISVKQALFPQLQGSSPHRVSPRMFSRPVLEISYSYLTLHIDLAEVSKCLHRSKEVTQEGKEESTLERSSASRISAHSSRSNISPDAPPPSKLRLLPPSTIA